MRDVQYGLLYIVKNIGLILIDPIFYVMAMTVAYLYKRQITACEKTKDKHKYTKHIITNNIVGIAIGILTSYFLLRMGIVFTLSQKTLLLIPIAILLMLINPKYGCFAYVVTAGFIIEGTLRIMHCEWLRLDYHNLINLVGLLHIIEGLLVSTRGSSYIVPTIVYEEKKLVVKHILQQIWLVPIIGTLPGCSLPIPIYTVLAYRDVAEKNKGPQQSRRTGGLIILFGIVVCILGQCVVKKHIPLGGAVILMPILHEFIFLLSQETQYFKERRTSL